MFLKIKWYDKSKERQILKKEKEMWYMEMNKYAGTQTEQNLRDAFSGESEARNKYTYFASVASVFYPIILFLLHKVKRAYTVTRYSICPF